MIVRALKIPIGLGDPDQNPLGLLPKPSALGPEDTMKVRLDHPAHLPGPWLKCSCPAFAPVSWMDLGPML